MTLDEESGCGLGALLVKHRRRRSEAARAADCGELAGLLLPLSVALARLAARRDVAGGASR